MARPGFKVHIGYTATGRNRWRRYATLAEAARFCGAVFSDTGIVLTIVEDR